MPELGMTLEIGNPLASCNVCRLVRYQILISSLTEGHVAERFPHSADVGNSTLIDYTSTAYKQSLDYYLRAQPTAAFCIYKLTTSCTSKLFQFPFTVYSHILTLDFSPHHLTCHLVLPIQVSI